MHRAPRQNMGQLFQLLKEICLTMADHQANLEEISVTICNKENRLYGISSGKLLKSNNNKLTLNPREKRSDFYSYHIMLMKMFSF